MDLLSINDLSAKEINSIFEISDRISLGGGKGLMLGRKALLCLLFEKASTRTRVSFEAAMRGIGGDSIYIDASTTHISRGEAISDTARVLSMYVNAVAARMYLHSDIKELAKYSNVPVINALTDLEHPCQALSDLYTIRKKKGGIKGMRIAFVGDIAANTANSLMLGATKLGADVVLVGPKSWKPNPDYLKKARSQGSVEVYGDMREGLRGADIIYTDTFVSMGTESEAAERRRLFKGYQVNRKAVNYAKKTVSVMHCLPAHRGEEITSDMLDGRQSIAWEQAANKLLVEKAILLYVMGKA